MGAVNDRAIMGAGTAEPDWLAWLNCQNIPRLSVEALCADTHRVVVVAPHPDDEILACGGLLAQCVKLHFPVLVVAITDGEASHGLTDLGARLKLGLQRTQERYEGLVQLGVDPACVLRLKIPDGQAAAHATRIATQLKRLLLPHDMVITTWCLDGHPDHEATARAVLATGCRILQAPVWMWHWAQPDDMRIPWADLVSIDLTDTAMVAKQMALARHGSQLARRSTHTGPVLEPAIVQRAARRQEYFFQGHGHR